MNQLITARHGEFGSDFQLNDRGRIQIYTLAQKLKSFMIGETICILTSTVDRARDSAEILGNIFNIGFEEQAALHSQPKDLPGIFNLVKCHKADVIILVTHLPYAENFPSYFAQEELGISLQSGPIGNGEAWVLDCLSKTLTHVVG